MRGTRWLWLVIAVSLFCSLGCASTQKLTIQTDPSGAEVSLQRRGVIEMSANVLGISGSVDEEEFEDEFYLLGNAPLDHKFKIKESEASISRAGLGGASITRHYREGTLRIEMSGYKTAERLVQFTGEPVTITISLQPLKKEE